MGHQLKAAALAGILALALVFDQTGVMQAQKTPDTPPSLANRFPTFTFPAVTLQPGKPGSVKTIFQDPGRNGQLTFTGSWPQVVTPDAEGVFHTKLKVVIRSTTGLRAEATGYSQTSSSTPKLQVVLSATRLQMQGTWFADITPVEPFLGTLNNIQIKGVLR